MKLGQLLMRFCRSSQTVAIGVRVTTATLVIVALLSPADAQFWGDSWGWGGRQQQRQQPYTPFGGLGRSSRGLLGRSAEGKPSLPTPERTGKGNREEGTTGLLPRAAFLAPKGCHREDSGDGRRKRRLACLRA
jgi:hypothetical protein